MFQTYKKIQSYLQRYKFRIFITILFAALITISAIFKFPGFNLSKQSKLPVVAIANYGPHSSLNAAILGLKAELTKQGFIEGQTIQYALTDVGFDSALIPQMITNLKNNSPAVMVVMTTPVAQFAKNTIQDIPLVYNVITDPVIAGLIKSPSAANGNITGSSDQQDLRAMLQFAKQLIPNATRVGLLYATAESNDIALVKMMEQAVELEHMQLVAVPVDQARDVPMRMQSFRDKVDLIYVGTSGPIQPTLPVIAAEANNMGIPIINVDEGAVKDHIVLASFGVDYHKVGENAGNLVAQILHGTPVANLQPVYPSLQDHKGFISKAKASATAIKIPNNLAVIVE